MSVSALLQRLEAQAAAGGPMDVPQIRKDIHAEHERATTTTDREALLSIHKAVMDASERQIRAEDLEDFRKGRREEYNLLVIQEAILGATRATSTRKGGQQSRGAKSKPGEWRRMTSFTNSPWPERPY